jgi:hypothetical protein
MEYAVFKAKILTKSSIEIANASLFEILYYISGGGSKVNDSIMNIYISNYSISSIQGPTIPLWVPAIGGLPINSPIVGSFLGVFLGVSIGVIIEYLRQRIREDVSRFNQRTMLKNEIDKCIEITKRNKNLLPETNQLNEPIPHEKLPSILPTDSWSSSIYTGALKLFTFEEMEKLIQTYNSIEKYNNEVKRYLDIKLNRLAMCDSKSIGPRNMACRFYQETILPEYGDELLVKLGSFHEFLVLKAVKPGWMVWEGLF